MGTWFIKNLGDAMLAGESTDHIKAFGATVCTKPASEGLSLLAGLNESWSVFFPC